MFNFKFFSKDDSQNLEKIDRQSDDIEILDELDDTTLEDLSTVVVSDYELNNQSIDTKKKEEKNSSIVMDGIDFSLLDDKSVSFKIGSNQKNIIKKSSELMKVQLYELVKILLNVKSIDGQLKTLFNKFSDEYINYKYFFKGELDDEFSLSNWKNYTFNHLKEYSTTLLEDKVAYNKEFVLKLQDCFFVIIYIDFDKNAIADVLNRFNYSIELESPLKKVISTYSHMNIHFLKSLDSTKFNLSITRIGISNMYMSDIIPNIKISSLFSREAIESAFHSEIVMEDLRNVQLKLLSIKVFEDWLHFSLRDKYLIYFPNTLYKKSKKIRGILRSIEDNYSQNRIIILLDYQILSDNYAIIEELKKIGFHFSIDCSSLEIIKYKDLKKYLCFLDYIYIYNEKDISEEILFENIPVHARGNVIYLEQSLIDLKEVVA